MTMSEDRICFHMLCFHVNQARFMVSAENFIKVLLLSYDVVSPYEHDREHVAAFVNLYNRIGDDIYHLAHYMFATGCRSDVDHFTKFIGFGATMDWSATSPRHRGHVAT
jgi:hypothetical protein